MTAARAKSAAKIDQLMEQASEALVATRYFECERLSKEAMALAVQVHDYERLSRIVMPLQESRRQKRQQATDAKKLTRIDDAQALEALLSGTKPIKPGCYLIEPPLVGADGRELRERADAEEVPIMVLTREPLTRTGLWPVVAVGPATTRTKLPPPSPKKLDVAWVIHASEALGDVGLAGLDPTDLAADRADHLLELLATIVDHEKLHQALAEACAAAAREPDSNRNRERPVGVDPEDEGFAERDDE